MNSRRALAIPSTIYHLGTRQPDRTRVDAARIVVGGGCVGWWVGWFGQGEGREWGEEGTEGGV